MNSLMIFVGIMAVISQAHSEYLSKDHKPTAQIRNSYDICAGKSNWALILHPFDCKKFYVCANNIPELLECPKNYYFDKQENRCMPGSCNQLDDGVLCQEKSTRPLEGNCNAFEICLNGVQEELDCESGYYFNLKYGICTPIADEPQHKCSCILPAYSVFKSDENCQSYYVCIEGQAIQQQCGRGQYFNPYLNTCIADLDGFCVTSKRFTMNSEELAAYEMCERIVEAIDNSNNAQKFITLPETGDCNKFFMCLHTRAVTKYCPTGFYFNRKMQYCEVDIDGKACQLIKDQIQKKNVQAKEENENNILDSQTEDNDLSIQNSIQHKPHKAPFSPIKPQKQKVLDKEEIENNSAEIEEFDV